jgi:hypothetical protein
LKIKFPSFYFFNLRLAFQIDHPIGGIHYWSWKSLYNKDLEGKKSQADLMVEHFEGINARNSVPDLIRLFVRWKTQL